MVAQREDGTKTMYLDKEIRGNQFLKAAKNYIKAQSIPENNKTMITSVMKKDWIFFFPLGWK